MGFERKKVRRGGVIKNAVVETTGDTTYSKKGEARLRIDDEVFDIHDSVADNAKLIAVLARIITKLYQVMPESQKSQLNPGDRDMIEAILIIFLSSNTLADRRMVEKGPDNVVQEIMDRQISLADIVEAVNDDV